MQLSIILYDNKIIYYVDKETGKYFKRFYDQADFPNPLSHFSFKIQAVLVPVLLLLNKLYRQLENSRLDTVLLSLSLVLVWLFYRSFQKFYSNLVQDFYSKTNQIPLENFKPTLSEKREFYQLLFKSVSFLKWFNRLAMMMILTCLYLFLRYHHIFALLAMVFFSCCMILLYVAADFKEKIKQIRFLRREILLVEQ